MLCSVSMVSYAMFFYMSEDRECKANHLMLNLMTQTFVPNDSYQAYLHGSIDSVRPFDQYSFSLDKDGGVKLKTQVARLKLFSQGTSADSNGEAVSVHIRDRFNVPPKTEGISIQVLTAHSSGDEYEQSYELKFRDINFKDVILKKGFVSLCLKPQLYR